MSVCLSACMYVYVSTHVCMCESKLRMRTSMSGPDSFVITNKSPVQNCDTRTDACAPPGHVK